MSCVEFAADHASAGAGWLIDHVDGKNIWRVNQWNDDV